MPLWVRNVILAVPDNLDPCRGELSLFFLEHLPNFPKRRKRKRLAVNTFITYYKYG
jgi:hypothetical protein